MKGTPSHSYPHSLVPTLFLVAHTQVSERELEEVAKMGAAGVVDLDDLESGSAATKALLPTYQQTPLHAALRTPMRTPGGAADAILVEAQNLMRLQNMQTPLVGGENPELSSDFAGATPRRKELATPNPVAQTPLLANNPSFTPRGLVQGTPLRVQDTPLRTPLRDG